MSFAKSSGLQSNNEYTCFTTNQITFLKVTLTLIPFLKLTLTSNNLFVWKIMACACMAQPSYAPSYIPVCVIRPMFLVGNQFDILVHQSPSSDGNLVIRNINHGILLKVEPHNTTIHHQRVIRDLQGRSIVTLREKRMTGHARWNAFRGNSNADSHKLFTTTRSNIIQNNNTDVSVFLENNTTNYCNFKIKGSWSQKHCAIYVGDSSTIIAQMQPRDATSFVVKIQPNVDYAFVVALIAIIDAMESSARKDKIGANARIAGEVITTIATVVSAASGLGSNN